MNVEVYDLKRIQKSSRWFSVEYQVACKRFNLTIYF